MGFQGYELEVFMDSHYDLKPPKATWNIGCDLSQPRDNNNRPKLRKEAPKVKFFL